MTTQNPDGAAQDESARSRAEEPEDHAGPGATGAEPEIPPRQIHRWKGEGGALHPDD